MIELRWYKEKAGIYSGGILDGNTGYHDAVLQYRFSTNPQWPDKQTWSEWIEVPIVFG